jgi:hypothetical protein
MILGTVVITHNREYIEMGKGLLVGENLEDAPYMETYTLPDCDTNVMKDICNDIGRNCLGFSIRNAKYCSITSGPYCIRYDYSKECHVLIYYYDPKKVGETPKGLQLDWLPNEGNKLKPMKTHKRATTHTVKGTYADWQSYRVSTG